MNQNPQARPVEDQAAGAPNETTRLLDLAGRIMLTHCIDPDCAARSLQIDHDDAAELINSGRIQRSLKAVEHERLLLFVNALQRLEWRLKHDSGAIRLALEAPLSALDGASIGRLLSGSLDDLRRLRRAIDTVEVPQAKWYRVGH